MQECPLLHFEYANVPLDGGTCSLNDASLGGYGLVDVYGMLSYVMRQHSLSEPDIAISYQRTISMCSRSVLYRPLGSLG